MMLVSPPRLGHGKTAGVAAVRQAPLEAGQQPVELADILGVELRTRGAHRGGADGAAPPEDFLAHGEAEAGLLLMAYERQIKIEQLLGFLALSVCEQGVH